MDPVDSPPYQRLCRTLFWLILGLSTLARIVLAGRVGLGVDESHYYLYSRHLAWGYLDHPPMVAYLAALTGLLGSGPFFVRLGPILCSALSLILLRCLALVLYRDERVALWSLVLLLSMPYQHLMMVALLPDSTLSVFWLGTLLAFRHAVRNGKWTTWILSGILFGGALLSKYHAILLPVCLFGYLLTSPDHRYWLSRAKPYAALLTGWSLFAPNIIWNAQNHWISYAYQWARGSGGGFALGKVAQALGGQLAAWSPVVFGLLVWVFIGSCRRRNSEDADRFALWTSLPVFAFFCGMGMFGRMLPHWTAMGWWSGALAVSAFFLRKLSLGGRPALRWRRWLTAGVVSGLSMVCILYLGLFVPLLQPIYTEARSLSVLLHKRYTWIKPLAMFRSELDISNELYGWDEAARKVEDIRRKMPRPEKTFVFAHRFFTASQIAVYLPKSTVTTTLTRRPSQYRIWFAQKQYKGWDALFVDENRYFKGYDRYSRLFERGDPVFEEIKVYRRGRLARQIRVYRYYGYRGKLRK